MWEGANSALTHHLFSHHFCTTPNTKNYHKVTRILITKSIIFLLTFHPDERSCCSWWEPFWPRPLCDNPCTHLSLWSPTFHKIASVSDWRLNYIWINLNYFRFLLFSGLNRWSCQTSYVLWRHKMLLKLIIFREIFCFRLAARNVFVSLCTIALVSFLSCVGQ